MAILKIFIYLTSIHHHQMIRLLSLLLFLTAVRCSNHIEQNRNTIFKMGFKTESTSTGPLDNSAFILKINDTLPPVLMTAHHTVAGVGNNQYVNWNELEDRQKNAWAWSMHDSTYNFKVGKNIPINNAQTLKLDIAAFYLTSSDVPYLKPSKQAAKVADTIYLFSKINNQGKISLLNRGVVVYTTDSLLVYELADFNMARIMGGTSGSCVLNKDGEVVSNSYAGFTIPNDEVKRQIVIEFPAINRIETKNGKTYGIGVPIKLIQESVMHALVKP